MNEATSVLYSLREVDAARIVGTLDTDSPLLSILHEPSRWSLPKCAPHTDTPPPKRTRRDSSPETKNRVLETPSSSGSDDDDDDDESGSEQSAVDSSSSDDDQSVAASSSASVASDESTHSIKRKRRASRCGQGGVVGRGRGRVAAPPKPQTGRGRGSAPPKRPVSGHKTADRKSHQVQVGGTEIEAMLKDQLTARVKLLTTLVNSGQTGDAGSLCRLDRIVSDAIAELLLKSDKPFV